MDTIKRRYDELVKEIMNYESDTFSSSEYKLKKHEAEKIAEAFIVSDIEDRISTDTMDGVMIEEELTNIRD